MDINCVKTRIYGGILAGGSADRLGGKPKGLLDNRDGLSIIDGLINARLLAKKLDITKPQMGKLLDELDVKVRECGLGCF